MAIFTPAMLTACLSHTLKQLLVDDGVIGDLGSLVNKDQHTHAFSCPSRFSVGVLLDPLGLETLPSGVKLDEVYSYAEQLHALPAEQKRRCARPKGTYSGSDAA